MDTKLLRQKILDLAIRGKLVPQDPNDEPASVLLERIKAEKEQLIKDGKIKRSKKTATADKNHYENAPFEIPSNWCWVALGEVSNYGSCSNIKITDIRDSEWVLELEDIEKDTAKIISYKTKSERIINGIRHKFEKGDILYSKLRTYLNKVLVAPNNGYCTTEIIPIKSTAFLSDFLCLVLRSPYFLEYTAMCGYGVKMPRLSTTDAKKAIIPVPPINEQKRIIIEIQKWFSIVDLLEQNKSDLRTTIQQAKSKILDLAIHGKLVSQDPADDPAIELLKRINPDFVPADNSHYENLPPSWCLATLGQVGEWQSGATPSRTCKEYYGGNIPWLKTGDLNDGYVLEIPEYITEKALQETSVKLNPAGSLLIAMYGATIGKIGILTFPATTNQACCACIKHDGLEQLYLYYFLLSHKQKFIKLGGGGAQPNISKEKIVNTIIPIPPISEQKKIVYTIQKLFNVIDNITAEL